MGHQNLTNSRCSKIEITNQHLFCYGQPFLLELQEGGGGRRCTFEVTIDQDG